MILRTTVVAAFGLILAATGCNKYVPVEGNVIRNGKPVESATVVFLPEKGESMRSAAGFTDAEGHFSLSTDNHLGVEPGKYLAIVTKSRLYVEGQKKAPKEASDSEKLPSPGLLRRKELLRADSANPDTTPFHFVVPKGGKKDFLIDL